MSYIDLHAHVLPGVDDGAETLEASLMMLRMASEHGTKALAVTPHGAGVTKTQYLGKFERLKAAAARESLPVKLFFGMEMMADGTLFDRLQSGDMQPLGESRFLLVEFDPLDSSEWCAAATEHIRKYGYVPLIAHPERYVILQNEPWRAELWTERGAALQVTRSGIFGEHLPEEKEEEDEGEIIKVAVIGKPNVGKSSLVNRVSGENRCIVSNIAGTTRDAVDTTIENKYGVFTFIDTAGLRRKSKVEDSIEHYSNLRAEMAVDRADVCVILIDATVGFTEQDSKVAGIAHEAGKGCIIAVNKWDAVEKDDKTMQEYKTKLEKDFSFMSYAPIIFISAQTGQRLDRLFELIHKVASSNAMRITTGTLNDILAQATARVQPPTDKGKRLKIYYMTQASTRPPTFICFVNSKELFHFSYQRYLENRIREIFSLEGTPVRMIVRERGDKAD